MANTMDQIKVRYGNEGKLVSIQEFLKTENLSGITKKIQDSTKTLYELNETEKPLFHFPYFPEDAPLIIDCTTPTDDDCIAHYKTGQHIIEFVRNLHENPHLDNSSFTEILAHELTHAEQDVEEIAEKRSINGLQYHQISLLMEGQAFAKARMVRSMLAGGKQYTSDSERINAVDSEIKWLINDSTYRNRWAKWYPIEMDDKPLTSIPKAFCLSNNLLSSIWTFPKEPLKPENKTISDIQENPREIYDYFFAIENNARARADSASELLRKLLFNENIKPEKIQQDLSMVHFLLNLVDDEGKPIFNEDFLRGIFYEKECYDGIDESKLLKEAEKTLDSNGKKILPENFSEKAKLMEISEFSKYIDNYLDTVDSAEYVLLDSDLLESDLSEGKEIRTLNEPEPPQPSNLRQLLKENPSDITPKAEKKNASIPNTGTIKKHQWDGR